MRRKREVLLLLVGWWEERMCRGRVRAEVGACRSGRTQLLLAVLARRCRWVALCGSLSAGTPDGWVIFGELVLDGGMPLGGVRLHRFVRL